MPLRRFAKRFRSSVKNGVPVISVGNINFSKPVSKLVNSVALAIGESVRKMEPRSKQQRGSLANFNRQKDII